jgi:hypothetical protein
MPSADCPHPVGSRVRQTTLSLLVAISLGLCCRPASGQAGPAAPKTPPAGPAAAAPAEYAHDTYDDALKKDRSAVYRILWAGQFGSREEESERFFDRYYLKHAFPRWTLPENLALLVEFRKDLRNDLKTAKKTAVHDHLNKLALDYFSKLAAGNYDPAVRVNAMLMIGELNAVEAPSLLDAPVALPEAREVLLKTVADEQQPEAVKVAALDGIIRHAQIGLDDPAARKAVSDAMLKLLNSDRPVGGSVVGHTWMQAQATEVLGELKAVGNGGEVAMALKDIVAASALPWRGELRAAAAEALGKLDYRGATELHPAASQFAAALGQLALDACTAETNAQVPSPRRLKYRVGAAMIGLTGTDEDGTGGASTLATGPPHQAFVAEVRKSLEAILNVAEEAKDDGSVLKEKIGPERAKLAQLLTAATATKTPETKKAE